MAKIWKDKIITWKNSKTWIPILSIWLKPMLSGAKITSLKSMGYQDMYIDDPDWLDICQSVLSEPVEDIVHWLADAMSCARITAYHACRTSDAGTYYRQGIKPNNPSSLADAVRKIVSEEESLSYMHNRVEGVLANFDAWDRDTGKVYLVADDRYLIEHAGHYLIYGSEWIMCVLGFAGHDALRSRGIPTILTTSIPLSEIHESTLVELARKLLHEWTRAKINKPNDVWNIDFSFVLNRNIPPDWIISHFHPDGIPDSHHQRIRRYSKIKTCPACR